MIETTDIPNPFFLERNIEYEPLIKSEGIKNVTERKHGFRYHAFFVFAHRGGGVSGGEPTPRPDTQTRHPRPDTQTRHPDTPTRKGRCRGCNPMQADAKGEKPMQADARGCKRKSKEARGRGEGQGAKGALTSPKGAKG